MPLRKPPPANLVRGKSLCEDRERRPNLPILKTLALLRLESSPIRIPDVKPISPTPSRRSGSSLYYDAPSEPLADQEEERKPFNTLQDLCLETDEPYPPQSLSAREIRSGLVDYDNEYNRSITQVEFMGYGQSPLSIREGSVNLAEEKKPLMRLKRRASCVGGAMGGLIKNIRRTSGSLRRTMTKALRPRNVQEVTRIGNRNRKEFMAGEETDTETNVTEIGNVVWKRVHHEM
jgi:hypothetical protein